MAADEEQEREALEWIELYLTSVWIDARRSVLG